MVCNKHSCFCHFPQLPVGPGPSHLLAVFIKPQERHTKDPHLVADRLLYAMIGPIRAAERGFAAMISEFLAKMSNRVPLIDRQRMIDLRQSSWTASSERFFDHYSFQPQFDLNQGLKQTCAWYKQQGWL